MYVVLLNTNGKIMPIWLQEKVWEDLGNGCKKLKIWRDKPFLAGELPYERGELFHMKLVCSGTNFNVPITDVPIYSGWSREKIVPGMIVERINEKGEVRVVRL